MHMRISKHFLADLYITRHTRETESERRIRNTLHKTCSVELVTSPNRNNRPYAISALTHSTHIYIYIYIYIYYWEFTDRFVQGKPNLDEYF